MTLVELSLVKLQSDTFSVRWVGGWVGGWEEKWRLKLTSAKVEVEVEAELGNKLYQSKSTELSQTYKFYQRKSYDAYS